LACTSTSRARTGPRKGQGSCASGTARCSTS
jgi:hypothetical protein